VKKLADASGPGLPSGHTQGTVVVWGYLGTVVRRPWFWALAGVLMVLVPLSRIYLGVHFPTDVLGGYILGALILLAWMWWGRAAEEALASKELSWQLVLAIAIPLLMAVLIFNDDGVSQGAALLGMGVGFIFERRCVGFDAGGVWWKRVLRFLFGVVVLFGLWLGLKALFAGLTADVNGMLALRLVRYGLVGLWVGGIAPWLFVKMGLAERRDSSNLALS
jgi:hypothetical protein